MEEKEKLQTKGKLLLPKLDVVFHALFREENKELLGALTSEIIKEEVKIKTTDKNRYINIAEAEGKLGVMDLRAELEDGTQCIIEIQLKHCENEIERILYYWADAYTRQAKRGELYGKLEKTISIVIVDHEVEELKGMEEIGVKWQIRDEISGKRILTNKLEIIIIELSKAREIYKKNPKNAICQWMMFLDNPNKSEVKQIMKENEDIKKAIDELEKVSGNEKIRRIAELKEKYIKDEQASIEYAQNTGYKTGLEKGKNIGRAEGIAIGEAKGKSLGKAEGRATEKMQIAKAMLKENTNIEFIAKVTGLTEEEIEQLK